MKKNKFLFLGMLALVLTLALAGCGGDPLVGTWLSVADAEYPDEYPAGAYKLVVTAPNSWVYSEQDESSYVNSMKGSYSGTTLTITHMWDSEESTWAALEGGVPMEFEVVIASDGKTLTLGEDTETLSFKKQ